MAILSGLFLLMALVVAVALLRPLLRFIVKLLAGVFIALACGVGLGVAADGQWPGVGPLIGLFAVAFCVLPSIRLIWSLGDAAPATTLANHVRPRLPVPSPVSAVKRLEPAGDEAVAAAWERAFDLVPQEESKLSDARRCCAALLSFQNSAAPADSEVIDAATLIRRHVPPLIRDTEIACRDAGAEERRLLVAQLVEQLQALAGRAHALTERARHQARDELALRHAHLRNRLSQMSGAADNELLQPVAQEKDQNLAGPRSAAASATWWSWLARPLTIWR